MDMLLLLANVRWRWPGCGRLAKVGARASGTLQGQRRRLAEATAERLPLLLLLQSVTDDGNIIIISIVVIVY